MAESTMACMICGGELGRTLLEITEPDRFERHCGVSVTGYRRTWVECSVCGATNDILPSESRTRLAELRGAYYDIDLPDGDVGAKYRKVMALPREQSDNWLRVQRIERFVADWFASAAEPLKLLDIGAGTGVFLSRFLEQSTLNWEAVAIEPDPKAAAHLRSLRMFPVHEDLFSERLGLSGFALVTLNKVVEHIEHPLPVLQSVSKVLSSDKGIVYVEVPDKLTIGCRPPTDNILGALHYHLYHPRSLTLLLERAGFEPLRVERVFEPSGKITVYGFGCVPGALPRI